MHRRRASIPESVAKELVVRCLRRCALCFGIDGDASPQEGQIAHIDRDSSKTSLDSLVWLCLRHHNEYDAIRFQTKGYLPSELRAYKRRLELAMSGRAEPQQVRWGPNDGLPTGISIIGPQPDFIAWRELRSEIESQLLSQLGRHIPTGCSVAVRDYFGRENWTVRILRRGRELGHIWFGGNPEDNWNFDGLVRAGEAAGGGTSKVWDTFQRYSDGTYRRRRKDVMPLTA